MPTAERITQLLSAALDKGEPFAMLLPSVLTNRAPQNELQKSRLLEATKIILLDAELLWVVYGVPNFHTNICYAREAIANFGPQPDMQMIFTGLPDIDVEGWPSKQDQLIKQHPKIYQGKVLTNSKGVKYYCDSTVNGIDNDRDETEQFLHPDKNQGRQTAMLQTRPRLIVPEEFQLELITWQHKSLLHASAAKVKAKPKQIVHWPDMNKDVDNVVKSCSACQILNARRRKATKYFRARVYQSPRVAWGMDFYSIETDEQGYKHVLGCIDLATSEIRLFPTKQRSAAVVTDCLLQGIILRDGVPLVLTSDHALEFISKAVRTLTKTFGIKTLTSMAYNPQGNAKIERFWQFLTKCLRSMSKAQHDNWHNYIRLMEHVWNTTPSRALDYYTPFQASKGLPARSALDCIVHDAEYSQPDTISSNGIAALKHTAKAFEQSLYQFRLQEAQHSADELPRKLKLNKWAGSTNICYSSKDQPKL
jgi:transposase InsO family protein